MIWLWLADLVNISGGFGKLNHYTFVYWCLHKSWWVSENDFALARMR